MRAACLRRGLPLKLSSHCLAALPAKIFAFHRHMRQRVYNRTLKRAFEDLLPCYCYALQIYSRTIRSQVSQPASAGKGADMSELQAHHCVTAEQFTWLLCSVSVIPVNKLSLQKLNQVIGIKPLTLGFL